MEYRTGGPQHQLTRSLRAEKGNNYALHIIVAGGNFALFTLAKRSSRLRVTFAQSCTLFPGHSTNLVHAGRITVQMTT